MFTVLVMRLEHGRQSSQKKQKKKNKISVPDRTCIIHLEGKLKEDVKPFYQKSWEVNKYDFLTRLVTLKRGKLKLKKLRLK